MTLKIFYHGMLPATVPRPSVGSQRPSSPTIAMCLGWTFEVKISEETGKENRFGRATFPSPFPDLGKFVVYRFMSPRTVTRKSQKLLHPTPKSP